MSEPTEGRASRREFSTVMINFNVVDRNGEEFGRVRDVNLERTCILVEMGGGRLRRKPRHPVHIWAVRDIEVDLFKISLAATKEDVAEAPDLREFDDESETAVARYYYDRLVALGENVDAENGEAISSKR